MIAQEIARILVKRRLTLATAESCTGGLLAHTLTNIPGSSRFFVSGVIAYANQAKEKLLGVRASTIRRHGAVSQETAIEMALGVKRAARSSVGVGITGIAGPGGGTRLKPVGTVFISVCLGRHAYFKKFFFGGTRVKIKEAARTAALKLLKDCLRP